MQTLIWQNEDWPHFNWEESKIIPHLNRARKIQRKILILAENVGIETHAKILVEDAKETSAIEGERLNYDSIHLK